MFDETNENQNVNETQVMNENQNVNPYMAGEAGVQPGVPVSPVSEEPQKKSSNKVIIGVIAAIVALLLIVVLVVIFGGLLQDDKKTVTDAVKDTFIESSDYIKDAWGIEQYEGMFKKAVYTVDAQLDLPDGMGIDMVLQSNMDVCGVYVDGSLAGSTFMTIQMYADDKEIAAALPGMVDYVFTINRETMADDIQNFVDMGFLDQESADEIVAFNEENEEKLFSDQAAYDKFLNDFWQACVAFYDKCEVKKGESGRYTVNGKEVDCKGYVLVITGENMAEFLDNIKTAYQENEEYVEALFGVYESAGIEMSYDLDEFYDGIDELAQECRDSEENAEIEFYLYDGKVARIYAEFDDGEYLEWNIEGGNFPLENTNIVIGDKYDTYFEIERIGSDGSKYRAEYKLGDEYETYVIDLSYSKEKGDFSLGVEEKLFSYEYSLFSVDGSFEKSNETTIEINIDSFDVEEETILAGNITIQNTCDSVEKPEGEEKELLLLSEEELEEIIWEIAMSLY